MKSNGLRSDTKCVTLTTQLVQNIGQTNVIHAPPTTTEALARIGALYAIEDDVRGKPADLRLSIRQSRARPLLDDMRKWMEKALRSLSTKSETAGTIR